MRTRPFEFREKEVILYPGFFSWKAIKYSDIISVTPGNCFQVIAKPEDFLAKPVVNISLGLTWRCALIESKWVIYGVMINNRDDFIKKLKSMVEATKKGTIG